MNSLWNKTVTIPPREKLKKSICTDTVVIGGGMAGLLTAYYLRQKGIETVVLEAAGVGSGQTGNTTAKITSQHNLIYDELIHSVGKGAARQYANANQQAIEEYRRLVKKEKIDCEWVDCPAYVYSNCETGPLEKEVNAAKELGIPAEFTTDTTLPFQVRGAVRFAGQACFHPLKFLAALTKGLTIYENTQVKIVEDGMVITNDGTVQAKHIVFASHYPFINMPGYYFMKMHQERSYVLALSGAPKLDGMYIGMDEDGLSFQNGEGMVLLGGGKHRTGENQNGGQYDMLRQRAAVLFPDSVEEAHWSAQDCMTLDKVPYIGQFCTSKPNWYVAAGFGKWGMTTSMVSAMIISDMIVGRNNPYKEAFAPQRVTVSASAKTFLKDGLHAVKDLSRQILSLPKEKIDTLQNGKGGIVDYEGEKVGVYKEVDGTIHMVGTRCPHLGCQLEWNPEEKSWDCPCHGSRFDYTGRLLGNPAQEDIPYGL